MPKGFEKTFKRSVDADTRCWSNYPESGLRHSRADDPDTWARSVTADHRFRRGRSEAIRGNIPPIRRLESSNEWLFEPLDYIYQEHRRLH